MFRKRFPDLAVTADGRGVAHIDFPLIDDLSWEGVDLNVAAIAADPYTGEALAASTFVILQFRDLGLCP